MEAPSGFLDLTVKIAARPRFSGPGFMQSHHKGGFK
jgi:hypothetical protein